MSAESIAKALTNPSDETEEVIAIEAVASRRPGEIVRA
jgi:hypothetical protein